MTDDAKLHDPAVAYAHVGFDTDLTFFKLYTRPFQRPDTGEFGNYEFAFTGYFPALEQAVDPVGYLRKACQTYLGHAIQSTGMPLHKWIIEFSPLMERFGLPSHLFLSRETDKKWLHS